MITDRFRSTCLALVLAALGFAALPLSAGQGPSIVLRKDGRMDADVRNWPIATLLERLSKTAGWEIMVEPGIEHTASARFSNQPVSDGLRILLGNLNFAVIPQTNGVARLYVFRASMNSATELIQPGVEALPAAGSAVAITNELVVVLKPGANIEELARALGAKVLGKLDGLNAYRLQFADAEAVRKARELLNANPEVAGVHNNYSLPGSPTPPPLVASSQPPLGLQVKAPPASGRVVVGLIDTAIQPLGGGLDAFIQPQISVAGPSEVPVGEPTHATSMAQTILTSVQNITGGSSSVQILPVDVYGSSGATTTFDVARGILTAVNAGANPINLSLGSEADSAFLHEVIKQAKAQGIVFFGAAGNQPTTDATFPAAYPEVTAVTAADRQRQIASYANRGNFVDIIAPGTGVVYYQGQPYLVNGTSAAAAFASGMAAGVAEVRGKPLAEVEAAMRNSLSVKPAGK
jgi:hypothetical protein